MIKEQKNEQWHEVCEAFAKKMGAKLVFVNESSCGLEFENGTFKHVYWEEMVEYLE